MYSKTEIVVISINAEKTFDKIQHSFIKKKYPKEAQNTRNISQQNKGCI